MLLDGRSAAFSVEKDPVILSHSRRATQQTIKVNEVLKSDSFHNMEMVLSSFNFILILLNFTNLTDLQRWHSVVRKGKCKYERKKSPLQNFAIPSLGIIP